ncbi:MAG: hypothetical protein A2521_09535 [Deltaproteobacteria bacterium RIFOXYD12_FULL_57_12]|nr:MAG: hypothetical protein A2521_09535 [Deltaproteobacteria bacterium RIFOXYD12_FULL_57_12]
MKMKTTQAIVLACCLSPAMVCGGEGANQVLQHHASEFQKMVVRGRADFFKGMPPGRTFYGSYTDEAPPPQQIETDDARWVFIVAELSRLRAEDGGVVVKAKPSRGGQSKNITIQADIGEVK